jgi:hypothetical protein
VFEEYAITSKPSGHNYQALFCHPGAGIVLQNSAAVEVAGRIKTICGLPIAFVFQVAKVLLLRYGKKYILHFFHFELPCVFLGRAPKSNVGCLILRYFPLSFYLLFIFSLIGFDGKFIVTHFYSTFLFPI